MTESSLNKGLGLGLKIFFFWFDVDALQPSLIPDEWCFFFLSLSQVILKKADPST